jgi:anion-transporting  ArsA/GET3 family ATPase
MTPDRVLEEKALIVCVGSGGVGKTTVAAALGLAAALAGRKVLVLTIDPARRLADAMGLAAVGSQEVRVPLPDAPGELWALMLDTRSTFDDLVRRISPNEETRERIFGNRIYQVISDGFASSQEYMATEKLYDVVSSRRYDLVVLDTPPVKNALDFLEAPGRLARFLDRHIVRWFMTPYDESRVFGKVIVGTSGVVFRLLGVIFGREFLSELSTFFLSFRELYDGFRERHESVLRLFRDPRTGFVVVCAPNEPSVAVAGFFKEELKQRALPTCGFVVNRVHVASVEPLDTAGLLSDEARELSEDLPTGTAARLLARIHEAHGRLRDLRRQEAPFLDAVRRMVEPGIFYREIACLDEAVQDMAGLRLLLERLLEPSKKQV